MGEILNGSEATPEQKVRAGSVVMLHFIDEPDDPVETYLVVAGSNVDNSTGEHPTLSVSSPVGQAILGAKPGDIVDIPLANNLMNRIRIMTVE